MSKLPVFPLLCAIVLLFGCIQPYSPGGGQQTPSPQPAPSVPANPPGQNASQQANTTLPQQNATPPPPPAQPPPPPQNITPSPPSYQGIPSTNLSVGDLLSQKISGISPPLGGPYSSRTYSWVSNEFESPSGEIALNPTLDILFDNVSEQNLVGFAFQEFTPTNGSSFAYGFAITANESLFLDHYLATGEYIETDFEHSQPALSHTLRNMSITSKEKYVDSRGRLIAVYRFSALDVQ